MKKIKPCLKVLIVVGVIAMIFCIAVTAVYAMMKTTFSNSWSIYFRLNRTFTLVVDGVSHEVSISTDKITYGEALDEMYDQGKIEYNLLNTIGWFKDEYCEQALDLDAYYEARPITLYTESIDIKQNGESTGKTYADCLQFSNGEVSFNKNYDFEYEMANSINEVRIPAAYTEEDGTIVKVEKIAQEGFKDFPDLTSDYGYTRIRLSSTIHTVEKNAFENVLGFNILFPSNVKTIKASAFKNAYLDGVYLSYVEIVESATKEEAIFLGATVNDYSVNSVRAGWGDYWHYISETESLIY